MLAGLLLAVVSAAIPDAALAWGAITHRKMTQDAFYIMPKAFREFLGEPAGSRAAPKCVFDLLEASVEPDKVLKDFQNHVYHIHGFKMGNGPFKVDAMVKEIIDDIKGGKLPRSEIIRKLGHLAHYVEDLAQPLHTGVATWENIEEDAFHQAHEKDVNQTVHQYGVGFDGCQVIKRISARMIYEALWANQYYQMIEQAYSGSNGNQLLDVRAATAACYSRAVNNVVDIWYTIWAGAGGKINAAVDGKPKYYPPHWSYYPQQVTPGQRVNLNRASLTTLMTVPGIGEKMAGEIIAARPFKKVEDLIRVRGMTIKLYQQVCGRFTL